MSPSGSSGPARLRELLAAGPLVVAPGAFDPFSARIVEHVGFPAVYLGGHSLGLHLGTGQPFTTLTETVDSARGILRVIDVPLIVDAGAGFGDPAHTRRTVRELERAGVAAIHIEDQPYPKQAGYHRGRGALAPVGDVVDKLRVAVEARLDPDLVLIARTDALRVTGSTDAVIERCHAFAGAGVDMIMVLDLEPDGRRALAGDLPDLPLVWIGGVSGPGPAWSEIESAGFKLAVYPFNTIAAVTDAVLTTWRTALEHGRLEQPADVIADARARVLELIGMDAYWRIEDQVEASRAARAEDAR